MDTVREDHEEQHRTFEELGSLGPAGLDGETLAELQGIPPELGEAILRVAEAELTAGRLEKARTILEGMVVTNHKDPDGWALLSITHRRLQHPLAARFCAEVAARLAPAAPWVRLTRAESLLSQPELGAEARTELSALVADAQVGARARSLLTALGA
jgi:predicted Zn-dependent protease